jgi:hypothetical protein
MCRSDMQQQYAITETVGTIEWLHRFKSHVINEELKSAFSLESSWHQMLLDVKSADLRMFDIKYTCSACSIATEALRLSESIKESYLEYARNGPASDGISLDKGLASLQGLKVILGKTDTRASEQCDSEQLLGFGISLFPELIKMEKGVADVQVFYDVYHSAKVFKQSQGGLLWSDVDLSLLLDSLDDFEQVIEHTPVNKECLRVASMIHDYFSGFRKMVSLLESLKADSVNVHHWGKVMGCNIPAP